MEGMHLFQRRHFRRLDGHLTALRLGVLVFGVAGFVATAAMAEEPADWWPESVADMSSGKPVPMDYKPLDKASKKWNICVLIPHLKDTSWVAADYGIIEHAKKLGVKVTVLEAGGYENLNRQVSQYDDCLALGVDAIIISPISEAGLAQKIKAGAEKKIVQVALINPVNDAPVNAAVFNDYEYKSSVSAKAVKELFASAKKATAIDLPGPAGSGWAESSAKGWDNVTKGSNIQTLDTKYGETGKVQQTKILEDAFQAYNNIDIIYGNGVAVESAPSVLKELGLESKVKAVSWFSTEGVWAGVRAGTIQGTADEDVVLSGAIGLDLAVRILEGKPYQKRILPHTFYADKDNLSGVKWDKTLAPKDWQPIFKVE